MSHYSSTASHYANGSGSHGASAYGSSRAPYHSSSRPSDSGGSRYHPYSGSSSRSHADSRHSQPAAISYNAPTTSSYAARPPSSFPLSRGGGGGVGTSYGASRYSQSSSTLDRDRRGAAGAVGGGGASAYPRAGSRFGGMGDRMHAHSRSDSSLFGGRGGGGRGKAPRNEFGIPFGQPGASLRAPDWANLTLPMFQKNFYREARAISEQNDADVLAWRKEHDIVVMGTSVPRPIRTFDEAGFPSYIMSEIARAGFTLPTAIQSQGWPMAMSGRDVIGIAETGSGKTLAFLLPCIVHINAQPLLRSGDGPIVLVIAPTRELAMQIEGECAKFAYSSKIKHCCVYGGVSRREQVRHLRTGVEIVICTPGRLLDFLECGTVNLKRVTYLVIDEADRLLDMGFEPQLTSMLSQVRPDRQILMWSATWPKEVRELSKKYFLHGDVLQVSVGSALSNIKANHNVTQTVECLEAGYEKQQKLYDLLRKSNDLFLVFSSTKKQCDHLYMRLRDDGYAVTVIHGDKQQYERDSALNAFKTGKANIMIATDVASRGIHVDNIYMVINYDFPQNIEDYVHRIGRTGRCGKKGLAVSFFTKADAKRAGRLIEILREAKQVIPPKLIQFQQYGGASMGNYRSHSRYSNYAR